MSVTLIRSPVQPRQLSPTMFALLLLAATAAAVTEEERVLCHTGARLNLHRHSACIKLSFFALL